MAIPTILSAAPSATNLNLQEPMVLLMTTKHMGNLLVSLHCLQTIAKASQGHSLLVVDENYRDIIESVTGMGKVLYYPRQQLKTANLSTKAKLIYSFYRQLRQHQASLLLDFDGQGQAATITQLSGIKECIGPADARRNKGVYTQKLVHNSKRSHRFNDYAQYLSTFLGHAPQARYPQLRDEACHRNELQAMLTTYHIEPTAPYVCIHVGATKTYKQWPAEHFATIADWLAEHELQVVFIGSGQADLQRINEVMEQCQRPHINLCDRLKIRQLTSLFQQCKFFLGNDSGPMHLAAAADAEVFAIFGPTDDVRWGPLGSKSRVIRNPTACENSCSKKLCPVNHRCINTLTAEQVKTTLQPLLV